MFSRFDRERLHPRLRARQLIPQLLVGRLVLCNLCCVLIVQRFQSRLVLSDSCMLLGLELLRSVLSSLQLSLQLCGLLSETVYLKARLRRLVLYGCLRISQVSPCT